MNPRANLGSSFFRIINHPLSFALLALLAVLFFGHGVYTSYQDKRAERAEQAEYAAIKNALLKCHGGGFCKIVSEGKTYRFLTISRRGE